VAIVSPASTHTAIGIAQNASSRPATSGWPSEPAELLPVPYFHLVFTLPQLLAPLALQNQKLVYHLLLRATAETLLQIAADPRHLGAQIGFLTDLQLQALPRRMNLPL
jgi:hypothetical protein